MIHSALHWPEVEDPALWPLAVQHAVYLYNHTPNKDSGIAPIEVYTRTINNCQALSQTQDKSHNVETYRSFSTGIVER